MTVGSDLGGFRSEARAWLRESIPADPRPLDGPDVGVWDREWQRRQYAGGWAGIDWPTTYGGRGLSPFEQIVWFEELIQAGGPDKTAFLVALNNVGPTLMLHGTEEQRRFHLPRILRGESIWCQGFSEPDAGSDLASLRTRAVIDGDEVVVTGQKIWTSFAQYSDYCELLARTSTEGTRHNGLTLMILDMNADGVEVRPIPQLDGAAEFCEVTLDGVRINRADVIGEVDDGWNAALSTLAVERGPANLDMRLAQCRYVNDLIELAQSSGLLTDTAFSERLATARAEAIAVRAMAYLQVSHMKLGVPPSPESTGIRTYLVELQQRTSRLAVDLLGMGAVESSRWTASWLYEHSASIGGGTTDIQRNIIGEKVLGLPR